MFSLIWHGPECSRCRRYASHLGEAATFGVESYHSASHRMRQAIIAPYRAEMDYLRTNLSSYEAEIRRIQERVDQLSLTAVNDHPTAESTSAPQDTPAGDLASRLTEPVAPPTNNEPPADGSSGPAADKGKGKAKNTQPPPAEEDHDMEGGSPPRVDAQGFSMGEMQEVARISADTHRHETWARSQVEPGETRLAGSSRSQPAPAATSSLEPTTEWSSALFTNASFGEPGRPTGPPVPPTQWGTPAASDAKSELTTAGRRSRPTLPPLPRGPDGQPLKAFAPQPPNYSLKEFGPLEIPKLQGIWHRAWIRGQANVFGRISRWRHSATRVPPHQRHAAGHKLVNDDFPLPDWWRDRLDGPEKELHSLSMLPGVRIDAEAEFERRFGFAPSKPKPEAKTQEELAAEKRVLE